MRVVRRASELKTLALVVILSLPTELAHAIPLDHLLTKDDIGPNKNPSKGPASILVIPVHVGQGAFPQGEFDALQNVFGPEAGDESFRSYWKDVSLGAYEPQTTLVQPLLYTDRCPLPGKSLDDCTIEFSDVDLITSGGIGKAFEDILSRLRDEQALDLGAFDTTGVIPNEPDGYFDGVIVVSNIVEGVAPPLAALQNQASVPTQPGGAGPSIALGVVAMAPPFFHEFGHTLGFIDLYGGPPTNDIMNETQQGTLSAFSRQQIGWGAAIDVTQSLRVSLPPALKTGAYLRVGSAPKYVLIENRSGSLHEKWESSAAGVYTYSIDESTLPTTNLGFLDLKTQSLYLPNQTAPYANVAMPVGCSLKAGSSNLCALNKGSERPVKHAELGDMGYVVRVVDEGADGTLTLELDDGKTPIKEIEAPSAAPPVVGGEPSAGGSSASTDTDEQDGGDGSGGCTFGGVIPAQPALWIAAGFGAVVAAARRRRAPASASRRVSRALSSTGAHR